MSAMIVAVAWLAHSFIAQSIHLSIVAKYYACTYGYVAAAIEAKSDINNSDISCQSAATITWLERIIHIHGVGYKINSILLLFVRNHWFWEMAVHVKISILFISIEDYY